MSKAFTKESEADGDEDLPLAPLPAGGKNYITPAGYAALRHELLDLIDNERPQIVDVVHWAASNGDRSENGDYLYGKKRLREIDRRIRFLTKRMEIAEITEPSVHHGSDQVFFGATVTYADAAGLAFDALTAARADGLDLLLVDTAGRLHNKTALMEELRKIIRVIKRVDETAPHSVLLVLDATTGQNAVQQVKVFKEMVDVTGLAVTKLDGSAKGGVVVALAQEFGLPVHVVGVGEKAEDLRPFAARDYARGLMGLD